MRIPLLLALVLMVACGGAPTGGIYARMAYSEEGGLRIVDVPPNGAAAKAGLLANDRIIAINELPVRELSGVEVVEKLRGPVGSRVELDVVRDDEIKTVVVVREPYQRR